MFALSRCATPKLGPRKWSTYTVLGFLGYGVASVFSAVLASAWDFTLAMRLVVSFAPPLAFIAVITVATALKGREWIVFYQTTVAGVAAVVLLGRLAGGSVWRQLDVAVLGIGVFLVFGRLGCFHVACCHGTPSERGVVYADEHVAVGFWKRWKGRPLVPVQLVESAGSAVLVGLALVFSSTPGTAALVYATGYALMRFALELVRGDPVRPFARGLSEAQWFALATTVVCAVARPTWWTFAAAIVVLAGCVALVRRRIDRELFLPPHLREIDALSETILADPTHARRETRLGVGISCHTLPDGRVDWIMSSTTHPKWSTAAARRIADSLWTSNEIIEGRTPGVVHVLVAV
ncbi:MAG: prolipoprotein diacylglyceryl transferase [Deltaproteobacteria bacterium]|nr:prolipoprotein diacylglyceryl transferase [Deltaproteobacteria bacterium]MDQ3301501.1 prolipoprotein diacylglyceryl transferase [Myxococcota bacterium]